ncbi:hypothetical protein [Methylacidiphilum caldifontis]|uniref:Uncharacterized protein n=1 Tax=Methylacidiphilum caldifontis TaxID=2795386 RepID=A0A4Y8PE53_9BACT|nr:hypothetical protein [Methylacidiphilum caldifontis]QSR88066.1 hypothetical protein IT6_06640 [Methylacidiphilum caldifontis]TFE69601.1 hypothetical protein A7Q10_07085 [Methylacidiphilum caldifontis]
MNAETILKMLIAGFSFTLSAGLYAFFYALGRLSNSFLLELFSFVFAFLMILSGFFLVVCPVFTLFWKLLLVFSIFAYLIIPKGMLWIVKKLHQKEK